MSVSPEEFFMYLTIALIVLIPISVRVHRYVTKERTARMLREQFGSVPGSKKADDDASPR